MLSYWKYCHQEQFKYLKFLGKKSCKLQLAAMSRQKNQSCKEYCYCDCSDHSVNYNFSKSVMCVEV